MIELLKIWPFIRGNYKLIAFAILTIAVIYLFFRSKHERERADEAERGRDASISLSNNWRQYATIYKNKDGDNVTRIKVLELDKHNIEELAKSRELQWLSKFEGLRKDKANLSSAETFQAVFDGSEVKHDTIYIECKDSLKVTDYHFKDAWNDIEAKVIGKPRLEIKDRYFAVIELIRPKHWFWKFQWSKRDPVAEITNSNKLIRIDSAAVITVK